MLKEVNRDVRFCVYRPGCCYWNAFNIRFNPFNPSSFDRLHSEKVNKKIRFAL